MMSNSSYEDEDEDTDADETDSSGSGTPTSTPEDLDGYSRLHTPAVHNRVGMDVEQSATKMHAAPRTHVDVDGLVDVDIDNDSNSEKGGETDSSYESGDYTESETEISGSETNGSESDFPEDTERGRRHNVPSATKVSSPPSQYQLA